MSDLINKGLKKVYLEGIKIFDKKKNLIALVTKEKNIEFFVTISDHIIIAEVSLILYRVRQNDNISI